MGEYSERSAIPQRKSSVSEVLNRESEVINSIAKLVEDLEGRLEPIMSSENGVTAVSGRLTHDRPESVSSCSFVEAAAGRVRFLESSSDKLRSILNRLEL